MRQASIEDGARIAVHAGRRSTRVGTGPRTAAVGGKQTEKLAAGIAGGVLNRWSAAALAALDTDDVLVVTRLDRLMRSIPTC